MSRITGDNVSTCLVSFYKGLTPTQQKHFMNQLAINFKEGRAIDDLIGFIADPKEYKKRDIALNSHIYINCDDIFYSRGAVIKKIYKDLGLLIDGELILVKVIDLLVLRDSYIQIEYMAPNGGDLAILMQHELYLSEKIVVKFF